MCVFLSEKIAVGHRIASVTTYFSAELRDFLGHCLRKDPSTRLPAETLLQHPWLLRFQATSAEAARVNVLRWIESTKNEPDSVRAGK